MRLLVVLTLTVLLAACGRQASLALTPTPYDPAAGLPGPTPTPFTPDAPPTAVPSPTTVVAAQPLTTLGYGHANSAAFLAGDVLAVGTSAGVLLLNLRDFAPQRFIALEQSVDELVASPNGQYLAVSTYTGSTAITRVIAPDGVQLLTLDGREAHFSADSGLLAVAAANNASGRYTTRVYNLGARDELAAVPGNRPVFSPDGRLIASFVDQELLITAVDGQEAFRGLAFGVAFSPDSSLVAVAGPEGVVLLPLVNGGVSANGRRSLTGDFTQAVAFDADGGLLAFGAGTLRRWNLAASAAPPEERGGLGGDSGAFGPAGALLALTSFGGDGPSSLTVLNTAQGRALYTDEAGKSGRAFFSPDGGRVAVLEDGGNLAVFDVAQGLAGSRTIAGFQAAAFRDSETIFVALRAGRGLERWSRSGAAPDAVLAVESNWLTSPRELTVDGERVVVEQEVGSYIGGLWRIETYAWALAGAERLRDEELPYDQLAFEDRVPWDYSPTGGLLARGVAPSAGGGLLVDDPAGGEPRPLPAVGGVAAGALPSAIAFSPSGARLAVGYEDGTLLLVSTADLNPVAAGPLGEGESITALVWSDDERYLAYALAGGRVAVWAAGDDDSARFFSAPTEEFAPPQLALSRDGSLLVVGSVAGFATYSLTREAETMRLSIPVEDVAIAPDGTQVAAVSRGQLMVWPVVP